MALGRQCRVSILIQAEAAATITIEEQHIESSGSTFAPMLESLLQGTSLTFIETGRSAVAVIPRQPAHKVTPESAAKQLPKVASGNPIEEVVVTSHSAHLHRDRNLNSYGPIDVLTRIDLNLSGTQTLNQRLKFHPAVSGNSSTRSLSNSSNGSTNLSLRGLPANNTLVLINGKRTVHSGFDSRAVDLNTIPLAFVDEVEILKSGASAKYAADAIAGTVNIRLRREFEGLSFEGYNGQSTRGDQPTEAYNLNWGTGSEKNQFMFSLAHYAQEDLPSRNRPLTANADNRTRGGIDLRLPASPTGFMAIPLQNATNTADGDYHNQPIDNRYNFREVTTALMATKNQSIYLASNHKFNDNLKLFVDAMQVRTHARTLLAPASVLSQAYHNDLTIAADNIYNPSGLAISDARKVVTELGPRQQTDHTDTRRFNAGFEGASDDWQWQLTTATHHSTAREKLGNLIDSQRLSRGLKGPESCREPDCVAINLLGTNGSIDKTQQDFIRDDHTIIGTSRVDFISFALNNTLDHNKAENITLTAAGIELRRETIKLQPSDTRESEFIGSNTLGTALGERLIGEAFSELSLPLHAERLWLDGALRYAYYSDVGDSLNPQLALRWRPWPALLLRGSYASGFSAPTLVELNQTRYQIWESPFNLCNGENPALLLDCTHQLDLTNTQYLTEFSGNPKLQAETSHIISLGWVWTPEQFAGFNTSLDIFNIHQQDVIGTVRRHKSFSTQTQYNNHIEPIIATTVNTGRRKLRGADISMKFQYQSEKFGSLRWAINSTYIHHYLSQLLPDSPVENFAGTFIDPISGGSGSLPHWKADSGAYWQRGPWESGYTIYYIGALREKFYTNNHSRSHTIGSWASHNVQLAYTTSAGLRIALGVDNLLDEPPPFAATAINNNFDALTYDLSGRFLYTTLSFNL